MNAGLVVRPATFVARALLLLALPALLGLPTTAHAAGDGVPPDTTITLGPVAALTPGVVWFEFVASEEPTTFLCSMDAGPSEPCASPYGTTATAQGPHVLSVSAVDSTGTVDPTPATYAFTILPEVAPPAMVAARAVSGGRKLRVDVEPDRAAGSYALTVQRRQGARWRTVARTRTRGADDVRTLDLRGGTYRVLIAADGSLSGATSDAVRIRR